jgi:hypothetical protein
LENCFVDDSCNYAVSFPTRVVFEGFKISQVRGRPESTKIIVIRWSALFYGFRLRTVETVSLFNTSKHEQERKRQTKREGRCSGKQSVYYRKSDKKFYGSKCSQAMRARLSGKSRLDKVKV